MHGRARLSECVELASKLRTGGFRRLRARKWMAMSSELGIPGNLGEVVLSPTLIASCFVRLETMRAMPSTNTKRARSEYT